MIVEREFSPVKIVLLDKIQIKQMYEFAVYAEEKARLEECPDKDSKLKNIAIYSKGQQLINLLKEFQ